MDSHIKHNLLYEPEFPQNVVIDHIQIQIIYFCKSELINVNQISISELITVINKNI